MKIYIRILLASFSLILAPITGAQEADEDPEFNPLASLNWIEGPTTADVTQKATIEIAEGYAALNATDTEQLMLLMENPSSGREYFVGPTDLRWFAIFEYDDTGHIKDDEEIDADALLESLRQGTQQANVQRRERGWAELTITGWQHKPFYEPETNRLAWAVLAESEGNLIVNYNTRLLGRTGVMSVTVVADPEQLDMAVSEFKTLLEGFEYKSGQRYAEFKPGDKVAAYGLAALVAGGTVAAVAKGAGKGLFKMIGLGIIAALAAISAFFKRIVGKKDA